jgi:hypothetical protein
MGESHMINWKRRKKPNFSLLMGHLGMWIQPKMHGRLNRGGSERQQ